MAAQENRAVVGSVLTDLENVWQCIDEMLDSLGPSDWSRKHGPDWTFADVSYHLAYFDRDIVANPIERGPDVPPAEQKVLKTMNELNAWNAGMFARRPAGQTPQQSLEQMRASRDAVRRAIGRMTDADLNRPVFMSLIGCGWLPAQMALLACRAHTWENAVELRLRLERPSPVPSPAATRGAVEFLSGFFVAFVDKAEAATTRFTSVLEITGPGGGAWTTSIANGACTQSEGRAPQADLVMTQSAETFLKTFLGMVDPMTAIQSGEIKVEGMQNMGTYARLFPPLSLDRVLEPMGAPAPW